MAILPNSRTAPQAKDLSLNTAVSLKIGASAREDLDSVITKTDIAINAEATARAAADVVLQTNIDNHINDTSAAHMASAIGFTPAGTVGSTDVQAAISEVATEYIAAVGAEATLRSNADIALGARIDVEIQPLRLLATSPTANTTITIKSSQTTRIDGTKIRTVSGGSTSDFLTDATINFATGSVTGNVNAFTLLNFTGNAGKYGKYALVLLSTHPDYVSVLPGTSFGTTADNTTDPSFIGGTAIGIVTVLDDGSGGIGTINAITQSLLTQSTAPVVDFNLNTGILTPSPGYSILIHDPLESVRNGTDDTIDNSLSQAAYTSQHSLYQISCDKTKTVSSNSGTSILINATPGFVVHPGDVIYVTSGVEAGTWRFVSTVSTPTSFVIDTSFNTNLVPGVTLMLSQAVHTKDLAGFGSASELNRPGDSFPSTDILQCLISYSDSLSTNDEIADLNSQARIVSSASNSGTQFLVGTPTSDTFTQNVLTRPTGVGLITDYVLKTNASQQRLFLVFFANPNNASVTNTCNLLDYDCNFYVDPGVVNGGTLATAYGVSDNSSPSYNMVIATSGTTHCDLIWSINDSVDIGGVGSQISVKVNGQDVPKFINSSITPSSQLSYSIASDINGIKRRVQFNADLSITSVDIMIIKMVGISETGFIQTNKLNGLYDAIVGSAAQVSSGMATHSTLQAAHDALISGCNILVLNNVVLSGSSTLSKRLMISGKGGGSVLTGSLTLNSGAAGSIIKHLKVVGAVQFNAGADKCFMSECYQDSAYSLSNDVSNVSNVFQVISE